MTSEQVLGDTVRAWVGLQRPGDRLAADRAATIAQATYHDGLSVSEACERVRAFLAIWARQPSRTTVGLRAPTRIAS